MIGLQKPADERPAWPHRMIAVEMRAYRPQQVPDISRGISTGSSPGARSIRREWS
jgi:hypothetical protein